MKKSYCNQVLAPTIEWSKGRNKRTQTQENAVRKFFRADNVRYVIYWPSRFGFPRSNQFERRYSITESSNFEANVCPLPATYSLLPSCYSLFHPISPSFSPSSSWFLVFLPFVKRTLALSLWPHAFFIEARRTLAR